MFFSWGALRFVGRLEFFKFIIVASLRSLSALFDVSAVILVGLVAAKATGAMDTNLTNLLDKFGLNSLITLTIFTLFVYLFKGIWSVAATYLLTKSIAHIESLNTSRMIQHLFRGGLGRIQNFSPTQLQWTLIESSNQANSVALYSSITVLSDGLVLILMTLLFWAVNPLITCLVLGYLGVVALILHFIIGKSLSNVSHRIAESSQHSLASISDFFHSFREIVTLKKTQNFVDQIQTPRTIYARSKAQQLFLLGLPKTVVETCLMIGILGIVGWQLSSGDVSNGLATLGVFLFGGVRMMGAAIPLQTSLSSIRISNIQSVEAMTILNESQIKSKNPIKLQNQEFNVDFAPASVEIKNLSFSYNESSQKAIDNISLSVAPGQVIAFIGPSGSGKSTLADLILGLLQPIGGSVNLNVPSSNPHNGELVSPRIGYVSQRTALISGTMRQNISMSFDDKTYTYEQLELAIEKAQLSEVIGNLPDGLDTEVGPGGIQLSGGQVQRIGLARALFERPQLLVLDEATSALDLETESDVSLVIENLSMETTIIIIAHRISTVQNANNVVLLESGKITAQGTLNELKHSSKKVQKYLSLLEIN